jgi:SAM-dependent methyltransferase
VPRARTLLVDVLLSTSIFLRRGSGLFTAMAIGACDEQELHARTTSYWDDLEELQSEGHTHSGLMKWESDVYERFLPPTGTIGLIGCGTGRDLFPLVERGYTVDAIDGSAKCIEQAHANLEDRGLAASLYCADISSFQFPRDLYDAFIISWFLYSYFPGQARRVAILAGLKRKLSAQGKIILSLPKSALISKTPSQRVSDWMARMTRNPTPPGELDYYLIRNMGGGALMWMREFDRQQITDEAARAGLELLHWQEYEEDDEPIGVVLRHASDSVSR